MPIYELSAVILYFTIVLSIGILSYRKRLSAADFIIGGRSLNYWLTAFAAQASDMSSWLFMAYPASIFVGGMLNAWAAIGLLVFMFLNWTFIAPKIRTATEQYNSLTFSSYFESRFADSSGMIRIFTAIMSLVFYTIYISSALVGLGILLETLFQIPYAAGILLGILIVIPYVFIGGYLTLAWIDLFQGCFLLGVILFVPLYVMPHVGGWDGIIQGLNRAHLPTSLLPDWHMGSLLSILFMGSWGLGYFGQPHIVTKFMGIKNVREIPKSKWVGMSWMLLSLTAATLVGLVCIAYFSPQNVSSPEQIFIELVKRNFHPFFIGFILCAILAVTINAMGAQVLVVSSSLTEDFYKKIYKKNASSKELLLVSRLGVIVIAVLAFAISYCKISSIYSLVLYAWTGLGCSFGPLLLLSLYCKKINKYGAWAGVLSGGILAAVWPYINTFFTMKIPAMIPAFLVSLIAIPVVSFLYKTEPCTNER